MARRSAGALAAQRGFTITELLVALTVTVIGLAGLLSLHVTTVKGNASASRALEAVSFAEQSLEALRTRTIKELEATYGPATTSETWYHWDGDDGDDSPTMTTLGASVLLGRNDQEYRRMVRIFVPEATEPNLVRVAVEIVWKDNAPAPLGTDAADTSTIAEHSLVVETLRARIEAL